LTKYWNDQLNLQDMKAISMPVDSNMRLSKDQCSHTNGENTVEESPLSSSHGFSNVGSYYD
jgi:hypothetical protein